MAKIIAPFKVKGTIDDLNFYDTPNGNYVRTKGKTGITKKQFQENPIFDRIRQQGNEFGSCVLKAKAFRLTAKQFFDKAKEGSFAGRVNSLLFEILEEDTKHPIGERKLEIGLQTPDGPTLLVGFEANKSRPLSKTYKRKITFNWEKLEPNIKAINPEKDINWPDSEANFVHLQLAIANWDYEKDTCETLYSNEITLEKTSKKHTLNWTLNTPNEKKLWIAFICISFSNKIRKKTKPVHKKENTATILSFKNH